MSDESMYMSDLMRKSLYDHAVELSEETDGFVVNVLVRPGNETDDESMDEKILKAWTKVNREVREEDNEEDNEEVRDEVNEEHTHNTDKPNCCAETLRKFGERLKNEILDEVDEMLQMLRFELQVEIQNKLASGPVNVANRKPKLAYTSDDVVAAGNLPSFESEIQDEIKSVLESFDDELMPKKPSNESKTNDVFDQLKNNKLFNMVQESIDKAIELEEDLDEEEKFWQAQMKTKFGF